MCLLSLYTHTYIYICCFFKTLVHHCRAWVLALSRACGRARERSSTFYFVCNRRFGVSFIICVALCWMISSPSFFWPDAPLPLHPPQMWIYPCFNANVSTFDVFIDSQVCDFYDYFFAIVVACGRALARSLVRWSAPIVSTILFVIWFFNLCHIVQTMLSPFDINID